MTTKLSFRLSLVAAALLFAGIGCVQDGYVWFNDDGAEGAATTMAPANSPATVGIGQTARLRMAVTNNDDFNIPTPPSYFELAGSAALGNAGDKDIVSGVTHDGFAYFGMDTVPGRIVKIDAETGAWVASLDLSAGEDHLTSATLDPAGGFAYFGTGTSPGKVVKIDLSTFTRVGAITLNSGENLLSTALFDGNAHKLYFSASTTPAVIVKVDANTFTRIGALSLNAGEDHPGAAVINTAAGFALYGLDTSAPKVVRIDLATFTHAGTLALNAGENYIRAASYDQDGSSGPYAYFGTGGSAIVKVDGHSLTRIGALTVGAANRFTSSAIDVPNGYVYFGTGAGSGEHVVRIALSSFTSTGDLSMGGSDVELDAMVLDPINNYLVFGTQTDPARVGRVDLATRNTFTLQYAVKGTSCGSLPLTDVPVSPTTEAWQMTPSTFVADGDLTSDYAPLSNGKPGFQPGLVRETSNAITGGSGYNESSELEFVVKPTANAVPGTTYCFSMAAFGITIGTYAEAVVPSVAVTAPNGGETITAPFSVTWDATGTPDHYRVSLSTDSGSTFPTVLAASDAGSPFSWVVNSASTTTARIKVEAMSASNTVMTSDVSDADFSVTPFGSSGSHGGGGHQAQPPSVTVVIPNGGEKFHANTRNQIVWSSGGDGIVSYRLSYKKPQQSDFWDVIDSSVTGNFYDWLTPNVDAPATRIRIEARDATGAVVASDESNADFSIIAEASSGGGSSGSGGGTPPPSGGSSSYDPAHEKASTPTIGDDKNLAPSSGTPGCTAGTLIRGSLPAVYYCGQDGKRYVFVNDKVYFSWYANFDSVLNYPDDRLAAIPIGGNVTYRPGVRMIKIQSDAKTYAVAKGEILRWVPDEATAASLYGPDWKFKIDDVDVSFFVNYAIGEPIPSVLH